ncbi:MAG: hypothetical protein ACXVBX_01015 [Flavisolibacter sp.]
MFTCDSYRRLHEELQAQLLFRDGIFLVARTTQKFRAELFSLYGFYVEIFFEETGEPLFIKPFEGIAGLKPYLGQININAVLQNINGD